jgi:fumarylacetoacetate (FAA) hydrolase family protein
MSEAPGAGLDPLRALPEGDLVHISTRRLGALENRVTNCERAPPWTFGVSDLMRNLAARGLLKD